MMLHNITRIDSGDTTEALPAFLVLVGIPLDIQHSDPLSYLDEFNDERVAAKLSLQLLSGQDDFAARIRKR